MKLITVLFTVFIIAIIVLADLGALPQFLKVINDFPKGDKVGHFVLFGLLDLFLSLTFIRSLPHRTPKLVALSLGLTLILLITLEEFSQMFFSSRTFDIFDLFASCAGVALGGFVALKLRR